MTVNDVSRPSELSEADITLVTRGITFRASVVRSNATALVLRPVAESYARKVGVKIGDPVELFWRGDVEELMLPAQVGAIDDDGSLHWNVAVTGEAQQSKRRKAVRAAVELPVRMRIDGVEVNGETGDLSEAGLRAIVDGWGLPPEPGTAVEVDVELGSGFVRVQGVVVRQEHRAGRWVVSVSFGGVPETDQDALRRRVFQALREERARAAD